MKLTVLGRYGPFEGPSGACSGYLLEAGDARVLIDCGNGVVGRLWHHGGYSDLDAVVLTHLHPDHISDLFVLRYALDGERAQGRRAGPLPVYSLPEPGEDFRRLPYKDVYDVRAYGPGDVVTLGGLTLRFAPTRHWVPACAVRAEAEGRCFVFSSDTGWSDSVAELARGADLFLCEANLLRGESEGHLSAFQAGELARLAGARRLLITHLFPGVAESELRREAEAGYGGPVAVAQEGATYAV